MFVVDDVAIAAAAEVATEVATEMATEAVAELATDMVTEAASEMISETASEMASEGMTELVSEASHDMVTDSISNISPESIVDTQDISNVTGRESIIIGDNIGEVPDIHSTEMADEVPEIQGDEVGDLAEKSLTDEANVDKAGNMVSTLSENIEDSPRTIKTINDGIVGQNHPDTGVPYVEKEVVTDTGEKVKGVFPQFESKTDIQLPEDLYQAPDRTQFAECNKQLQEKVAGDQELRSQFTEDQLADIEDGCTPEGYTWHHNEEIGKMQLVDSDIHNLTRHTGGRNVWGGGTENRH